MSSRFALSPRAAVLLAGVVAIVALVVIVLGARSGGASAPSSPVEVTGAPSFGADASARPSATPTGVERVVVHVAGAVGRAGVVTLPAGSRVSTAVERAGGAARDADVGRLNLARVLIDGERVYVPRVGAADVPAGLDPAVGGGSDSAGAGTGPSGTDGEGVVDLNAADARVLDTLPGIGPALAARIVAWRDEHGRFSTVEDLLDVSGIGDAKFADLQDRVRV